MRPPRRRVPARLGDIVLERPLGSGSMGTVYRAFDAERGRRVAVKVLHAGLASRRGFFARFEREASAGLRVDHPNVVRTLDYDMRIDGDATWCYVVMEHVEGCTLREALRIAGPLPEPRVREIGRQLALGLSAVHEAGIVHRDLKPENVMLSDDGRTRILDLGVARLRAAARVLTQAGQFAGSVPYAAPEQFLGGPVGPAADLYALGVVLYEAASGENPLRRGQPEALLRAHLEDVPPPLAAVVPGLSDALSSVVASLLAKDPALRPSSAAEVAARLATG